MLLANTASASTENLTTPTASCSSSSGYIGIGGGSGGGGAAGAVASGISRLQRIPSLPRTYNRNKSGIPVSAVHRELIHTPEALRGY